jgi:hypothetical protein
MKKLSFHVMAVLSLVLVYSCGPKITSNTSTQKDLSKYKTYAYLPNSNAEAPANLEQSEDVGKNIVQAINRNMQKVGYILERDNPDLLVIVNTNYDKETNAVVDREYNNAYYPYTYSTLPVNRYYNSYYYNGYNTYNNIVDYDVNLRTHTNAGMVINVVDRETKNILWTGTAKNFDIYQQNVSQEVSESVDNVFEKYPTVSQ